MLDGTKTKKEIVTALQDLAQKQQLQIRENNILVVDPEKVKTILEKQLEQALFILAMNSLLIA